MSRKFLNTEFKNKTKKLKINSVFLTGRFKKQKAGAPKSIVKKRIGGNTFHSHFATGTFSWFLNCNIGFYLCEITNLAYVIKKNIDDELKPAISAGIPLNSISAHLQTLQASRTYDNLKANDFFKKVFFPICNEFDIEEIEIFQEKIAIPTKTRVFQENFYAKKISTPSVISFRKTRQKKKDKVSIVVKFQINTRENKVSVSIIATDFFPQTKKLLEWLGKDLKM